MNISSRPPRNRSALKTVGWVALVCFFLVLANALISGARKPQNRPSATLQFVDEIRPFIDQSNAQAAELASIRAGFARENGKSGPTESAKSLQERLHDLDREVANTRDNALDVTPEEGVRDTASLVWATFSLRAQAVDSIDTSLTAVLKGDQSKAEDELAGVNAQMAVSDSDYRQFQATLKSEDIDAKVPDSVWLKDVNAWQTEDVKLLIATWKANLSSVAEHNVSIISVVTDPAPIRDTHGSVEVMPSQKNMDVSVVVGNIGNVTESRISVRVRINAPDGTSDGKNDSITLKPGGQRTVLFKNIRVVPGGVSTLVIEVGPVAKESATADNTKTISFTMNPTDGTTTTITMPTTSSTL